MSAIRFAALLGFVCFITLFESLSTCAQEPIAAVEQQELLDAQDNNANWLMYGRTYNSNRYSALEKINRENVSKLVPEL